MQKLSIKILTLIAIISTFYFYSPIDKAKANTYIDPHIDVISVKKNSTGTISIKYKVKKVRPSAVNVCLGYNWPANYRLSSTRNYCKSTKNKKGTYTMKIPKPSINIIGSQNVVAKVIGGGGRYSSTKKLKTVFNHPNNRKTTYHTISKANATAEYFTIAGLGVGVKFMKRNAIGFVSKTAYSGWTTHYGLKGIGAIKGFPPKVAGQYYKVETYYSQKGLHVKTTIWNNKAAFKSNHKPIYQATSTSSW